MLTHQREAAEMGENGYQYVEKNYKWSSIIDRLRTMIGYVMTDMGERK